MTFSIDGATAESYVKYRQRGDFAKAIRNLTALGDEKRKNGLDVPFVNWRYILFTHNDSDEEMELARKMAAEIGVDRLSWEITDHPENMFSRRFVPGTPEFDAHRARDLGQDRPRQRDSRRHAAGADRHRRHVVAGSDRRRAAQGRRRASRSRSGRASPTCRSARSRRSASYGRRLVRLGAQLCADDGTLINRDYERAWLPAHLQPGATMEIPITLKAPETPGRYQLKFDLVSEGIDWFEQSGSQTTVQGSGRPAEARAEALHVPTPAAARRAGSTRIARLAGIQHGAPPPRAISDASDDQRVGQPDRRRERHRAATSGTGSAPNAPAMPDDDADQRRASRAAGGSASARPSARAPIAMRMPTSCVRWLTACEVTP